MSDEFAKIDHEIVTKSCAAIAGYIESAERTLGRPDAVKALSKALVEFNMLLVKLIHVQSDDDITSAPNIEQIKKNLGMLKTSLLEASKDSSWFPDMERYSDWIDGTTAEINAQIQEATTAQDAEEHKRCLAAFKQSMPDIKVNDKGEKVYDYSARSKRNTNVLNPIGTRLAQVASDVGILLAYDGK